MSYVFVGLGCLLAGIAIGIVYETVQYIAHWSDEPPAPWHRER